jgi:cobalamin biosynthesis protein CobD/CbiB
MSAYDPQLHDQQRELEALKARLARQERTTGVAVLVAMILAALTLALFVDELLEVEWPLGHLIDFIL